jgi:hypothetical protein
MSDTVVTALGFKDEDALDDGMPIGPGYYTLDPEPGFASEWHPMAGDDDDPRWFTRGQLASIAAEVGRPLLEL